MDKLKLPDELYRHETAEDGRTISICTMRQMVLHCIGMDGSSSQRHRPYTRHGKKYYRPWRNYFNTFADDATWTKLCEHGYAAHGEISEKNGTFFRMTRKGLDWLGEQLGITIYNEGK